MDVQVRVREEQRLVFKARSPNTCKQATDHKGIIYGEVQQAEPPKFVPLVPVAQGSCLALGLRTPVPYLDLPSPTQSSHNQAPMNPAITRRSARHKHGCRCSWTKATHTFSLSTQVLSSRS